MKFKGNFGELTLNINGTEATGTYQENSTLKGEFVNNNFKGQWENKGMEGLVEFSIKDNKLEGNWKKGIEPGPMKGKWDGELILTQETKEIPKENITSIAARKTTEIMAEIEVYPNPEYGDSYGTSNVSVQIDVSIYTKLIKGVTNYSILRDAIFDILDNNMKTIIDYFMIFDRLADLTHANYDWFHMDPKIRILTIGTIDLSPIYNLEGKEFRASQLLNKESEEIEDWVDDFITDCQYGLEEDNFKKCLN
jgi:hypothetical protein